MSACVGDDEIALCDRNCHKSIEQGLAITGGIPVFLQPHAQPLRHHRADPARAARAEGDREGIAAQPAGQARQRASAPVYSVLTNCTYDGMCYDAADAQARLAKSVDRIHFDEAWYGYARFNPMYRDRYAMRGESRRAPEGRPDRLRHPLHPQAAGRAVADLVHPHP